MEKEILEMIEDIVYNCYAICSDLEYCDNSGTTWSMYAECFSKVADRAWELLQNIEKQ